MNKSDKGCRQGKYTEYIGGTTSNSRKKTLINVPITKMPTLI